MTVSDLHDSEITGVGKVPSTKPTGVAVADLQVPQDVPQGTNADTDFGLEQEPKNDPYKCKTARCPTGEPPQWRYPKTLHPHPKEWLPAMPE